MKQNKEDKQLEEKKLPRLSPEQYWEWRTTVTELQLAKKEEEKITADLKILQKDAEISAIRFQLFQCTRMEAARQGSKDAQAEYERFTVEIEKAIGVSLKNKIIDDSTFEIRDVPEQIKKTP